VQNFATMAAATADAHSKNPQHGKDPPLPAANNHYCWTHGHNNTHHGSACTYPKKWHQPKATAANTMGGEQRTAAQVRKDRDATRARGAQA
jgi:hypothetical protein